MSKPNVNFPLQISYEHLLGGTTINFTFNDYEALKKYFLDSSVSELMQITTAFALQLHIRLWHFMVQPEDYHINNSNVNSGSSSPK